METTNVKIQLRTLYQLIRNGVIKKTPGYLVYFVTARCNARCKMCFYWRQTDESARRRELTVDEVDKFSKSMGRLFQVVLSGGEPFLRDDLDQIALRIVENCRPAVISIPTNGSLPERTVAVVDDVCRSMPKTMLRINISIDGIGQVHDDIRCLAGSFEKAVATFRELRKLSEQHRKLTVNVITVLSKFNRDSIDETVSYVRDELRPDFHSIGWTRGEPRDSAAADVHIEDYQRVTSMVLDQQYAKLRQYPLKRFGPAISGELYHMVGETVRQQRQVVPCLAGQKTIVVDDKGTVYPCELLEPFLKWHPTDRLASAEMGRLRESGYSIPAILRSDQARRVCRFIAEGRCHCTYECALTMSLLFNPVMYPQLACRAGRTLFTRSGCPTEPR